MPVHLELPAAYAGWVKPRPWLTVTVSLQPAVEFGGWRHPLALHSLPRPLADEDLKAFVSRLSKQAGAVVVASLIPSRVRTALEESDVGHLDSRGSIHIVLPTAMVHTDAVGGVRHVVSSGIGPNGVRVVQQILLAEGAFTLSGLAERAQLSLAQTHMVLTALEARGFVGTTGTGPARRRFVVDRTQLLDWFETQPVARRREPHLDVTVYARRPQELWTVIAEKLRHNHIAYGLTGSAAASIHGVGPTSVLLSTVRINPASSLETAAAALGATVTERGPNLRLVRDTGNVGSLATERVESVDLAPRVRIYLDALQERRGEDVAHQFREVALGY